MRKWINIILESQETITLYHGTCEANAAALTEAMGNLDRTFYHVTLSENLPSIMEKGLVPSVGERSKKLGEHEAIFLFASRDDAEDALANWLGDEFDDDAEFALLEVIVPAETAIYRDPNGQVEWEVYVRDRIPPDCIHILEKNF